MLCSIWLILGSYSLVPYEPPAWLGEQGTGFLVVLRLALWAFVGGFRV